MSKHKKRPPLIVSLGAKPDFLSNLQAHLNDLPLEHIQCSDSKKFLSISGSSEVIAVVAGADALDTEALNNLNKLREKNQSDASLIVLADSSDINNRLMELSESALTDILYLPLPPIVLKNKLINYLDLFERRNELSLALKELESNKRRLASDQQKLKILTSAVSEPIIFIDQDLMVRFWNSEAESFFGYTKFEVVNESFLRWLVAPQSHAAMKELFEKVKKSGAGILKREQSFVFRNKLGVEIFVESTLSYHKTGNDQFNLVFVVHDTSAERRLEKETQRAREYREENKLMRELLNHVNHELRTPLNAIVGISKTLLSYNAANLNERQHEGIDLIKQSGTQLLGLIRDLLEISQVEANKLTLHVEEFDFDKLQSQQKTQTLNLIDKKQIKLVWKSSPAIPKRLLGDVKKINQVLTNVVGNAVKYTTEGKIAVSSHLIDNKLYFEVTDTGVGIPKDKLSSIFDKFSRVKSHSKLAPGTGLGLHITKKLIELMSGEIKAESEPGKGTTIRFFITLPAEVKPLKPSPIHADIETADLRVLNYSPDRKLIMVIDDSVQNTFIYSILSEQDKYSVMVCSSSRRVISTATEFLPDLILIKLEMPALHGSSIIKELRRKQITVPVIAFSEYEKYKKDLPENTVLLSEPMSLEVLFPVLHDKIKWQERKHIDGAVLVEEDTWFMQEKGQAHGFIEVNNKEEELTYIKLSQAKIDYLVIEHADKNSNGLSVFLKLVNQNKVKDYKKIILHHEAAPMKYLTDKISSYPNVFLMTRMEILNEVY
jgi:PAS domain S-box-containing protein